MGVYKRGDVWYIDSYAAGERHQEAVSPKKKEAGVEPPLHGSAPQDAHCGVPQGAKFVRE